MSVSSAPPPTVGTGRPQLPSGNEGPVRAGALALIIAQAAVALAGCQSLYVIKQGWTQISLGCQQVALDDEALEASLTETQREKLTWVPRILEFAKSELGLDPGDSYQTLLDTGGQPVSHIVTAAHPYALQPYRWCFPFVGCVTYKGYFDAEDARSEGVRLAEDGWDVAVLPVAAYSTLGWFRDPVLSTMLDLDLPDLVELLIHETTHRTLYVPSSTEFNESLATHVARAGTELFLARHPEAADDEALRLYASGLIRQDQRDELVVRLQSDLERLYRRDLSEDTVARRKSEIFGTAGAAAERLGFSRHGFPASNAHLLAGASYRRYLKPLARLQKQVGGHPRDLMTYLQEAYEKKQKLPEDLVSTPP